LTEIFVFSIIVIIIVFDVYVINKKGRYHSVSAFLIRAAYKYPMIPFLMGYVMGHLFWVMDYKDIWTEIK